MLNINAGLFILDAKNCCLCLPQDMNSVSKTVTFLLFLYTGGGRFHNGVGANISRGLLGTKKHFQNYFGAGEGGGCGG